VAAAAAGLLVALPAVGAGAWWLDRQRSEQRQAVEATLEKVGELQGQARWKEAAALLEREKARLGHGGPMDLQARLARAQAELDLVKRLDDVRLKRATIVEGHFDYTEADKDYEDAFREAGMGEVGGDAAAAAARVGDTSVHTALAAALYDWAYCTNDEPRRSWVLDVARRADPWRDRARDPVAWGDAAVLARRVQEVQAAEQSPQLLVMLAMSLPDQKREDC
jgi:serine/threonine-protein kinase